MAEDERRRLLRTTDDLLERIEQMRLHDRIRIPERLRSRVAGVAAEMGESARRWTPATLADAHDRVFRLQRLLLRAGGGRSRRQAADPGALRPIVPPLSLPARRSSDTEAAWQEQVRLIVQRAHDRARYLRAQTPATQRTAGAQDDTLAAERSVQARDAQQSFERLRRHAERVTGRPIVLDLPLTVPTSGRLALEDLIVDLDTGQVQKAGRAIRLTPSERTCLVALTANQDRILTREALQHLVSGDPPTLPVRSRTLDVHMSRIRSKLGNPPYLESVPGVGYRMTVRSPASATSAPDAEQVREQRRADRRAWARGSVASPPATAAGPRPAIDRRPGR